MKSAESESMGDGLRNILLVIEYDGTGYHGWQVQPHVPTIQGTVEGVIGLVTQSPVRVIGSGRTDAGVHALNQVANFHTPSVLPLETLKRAMNALLPKDIVVKEAREVAPDFHARYDARRKRYRYRLLQSREGSAFLHRYCWIWGSSLSLQAMERASSTLIGRHDFSAFQSVGSDPRSPVRELYRLEMEEKEGGLLEFVLEANGFLKGMVRNIVGTLVEVGRGRIHPEDVALILKKGDRQEAGATAPAHGLFLERVYYEEVSP